MKNISVVFILLIVSVFNGCGQNQPNTSQFYLEKKKDYEKKFVDQFPEKVSSSSDSNRVFSYRYESKNDVALMLYEYGLPENELKLVGNRSQKQAVATYNYLDSCLLIVNRFETKKTMDNYELPDIKDSTLLDKECYHNKLPIPNFIIYEGDNGNPNFGLDNSFKIYVFEAKKKKSWLKEFNMKPAYQMPKQWQNGYSKGIAISEKKKTVIYWTVIW